jgi:hypothetical protein
MTAAKPRIQIGEQFERWTVLSEETLPGERRRFRCRCICGSEKVVDGPSLRIGASRSCGCLQSDVVTARRITHGDNRGHKPVPEYVAWTSMKNRCTNPKCARYEIYGGRGIEVCQRWMDSYEAFLADVGRRPGPEYSLDRYPNTDGNYEPGNVRWATRSQQSLNRRPFTRKANRAAA